MSNNLLINLVSGGFGKWFRKPQEEVSSQKSVTYWHPKETDGRVSWLPSDNSNDSVYNVVLEFEQAEILYWEEQLRVNPFGSFDHNHIAHTLLQLKRPMKESNALVVLNKNAKNLADLQPGAVYLAEIDASDTAWITRKGTIYHFSIGDYKTTGKP